MRNSNFITLALVGLLLGSAGNVSAQVSEDIDNIGYGTRAGEFLLLPVGARGAALGQAFTAMADDATALHWNPAGLGFIQQMSAHFSHFDYVAGTSYSWGGLVAPLGTDWVIGFQFGGFNFGDQEIFTELEPDGTGQTYSNSMVVAGVSGALNISDKFAFGATAKYVQENLARTTGSTIAFDVGTNYHTDAGGRPLRASFSILNLGGEIQQTGTDLQVTVPEDDPNVPARNDQAERRTQPFPLPVMFKVGVAYDVVSGPSNRLTLAGEFWQPQQNATSAAAGAEFMFSPNAGPFSAAARIGYTFEPDRSYSGFDEDGADGLGLGGGIMYRPSQDGFGLGLDYAYRHMGLLEGTHMFSVNLSW